MSTIKIAASAVGILGTTTSSERQYLPATRTVSVVTVEVQSSRRKSWVGSGMCSPNMTDGASQTQLFYKPSYQLRRYELASLAFVALPQRMEATQITYCGS